MIKMHTVGVIGCASVPASTASVVVSGWAETTAGVMLELPEATDAGGGLITELEALRLA